MKKNLLLLLTLFTCCNLQAQIQYTDAAAEVGFDFTGRSYGVSLGDYDNDGDDDIYIARHKGANDHSHILLKCRANGSFSDVTEEVGLPYMGTPHQGMWGDMDNDGDLDLFVICRDEPNLLYRNDGGTFTDISVEAGINAYIRASKAGMVVDVNNDSYIDFYVANIYTDNELWINNGDGTFTDETIARGVNDNQIAMGSTTFDYDNDGDQDMYLTHDGNQEYILFENDGNGYFTDVGEASGTNYAGQGMGVDVADINNDGWMDIYITNLSSNTLFINNGDKTFTDVSDESMTTDPGMGWGLAFTDIDNDGLRDIYMANDSYFSPNPNRLYRNMGDHIFEELAEGTSLESMVGGYGVACGDFNNDGREDIFLANSGDNDANQLFRNDTQNDNNYVKIKLKGTTSNRSAIGARVEVTAGGVLHIDDVTSGMSYSSASSLVMHFGLGTVDMIENITVRFPAGELMEFTDLAVNTTYVVTEGEALSTAVQTISPEVVTWSVRPTLISDAASIGLHLKEKSKTSIAVYDVAGQLVDSVFEGELAKGNYDFTLRGEDLPKGILFVELWVNGMRETRKIIK
jgi:hypothetical protein